MPANLSDNKVRVTRLFGGGETVGWMNPKIGLITDRGTITALDSGNFQVSVSGQGVGLVAKAYPHDLFVTQAHATGFHAFPTGDGSVVFGRKSVWPNGVPDIDESQMFYKVGGETGSGVFQFTR